MENWERMVHRLSNAGVDVVWGQTKYGDDIVLFADNADYDRWEKYFQGEADTGFQEEYTTCDNCFKLCRNDDYHHGSQLVFFDGYALCLECTLEDWDSVESKWLNEDDITPFIPETVLEKRGFELLTDNDQYLDSSQMYMNRLDEFQEDGYDTLCVQSYPVNHFTFRFKIWGRKI